MIRARLRQIRKHLAGYPSPRERAEPFLEAGRLEVALGTYKQAIKDLKAAIDTGALTNAERVKSHFHLGQALAMQDKYREAIPHAQKAIELSGPPQESHYRLLLFCFGKLKRYRDQVVLLERMAKLFPPRDEYNKSLEKASRKLKQPDN